MVGMSPPEFRVASLRPGSVVAGVASGSMDEPLPNVSRVLGLSGWGEMGLFSPLITRAPPFLPLDRPHKNLGRRLGLDLGLGLGLGLTECPEDSGSELATLLPPTGLRRSRPRLRLGVRKVSLSGEAGALRICKSSELPAFGRAMETDAAAELCAKVLVASGFFLCLDFSFLPFEQTTTTVGGSLTGDTSLSFSAMVFIQRGCS